MTSCLLNPQGSHTAVSMGWAGTPNSGARSARKARSPPLRLSPEAQPRSRPKHQQHQEAKALHPTQSLGSADGRSHPERPAPLGSHAPGGWGPTCNRSPKRFGKRPQATPKGLSDTLELSSGI